MADADFTHPAKPGVLVFSSTFPRWTGDKEPPFVYELCRRLCKEYNITVLAPHAPGSETEEEMHGIHVRRFRYFFSKQQTLAYQGGILENLKRKPLKYLLVPFFLFFQFLSLVRLLRREKFDLIHAHWIIPQGLLAILAKALLGIKTPLLCTSHGGDLYALKGKMLGRLKNFVIRHTDRLTVVSSSMRDFVLNCRDDAAVQVIPMGVDLSGQFIPGPAAKKSKSLLYVGRLVEKKGVRYLIESLSDIVSLHPDAHLTIVGSGPDEGELAALVNRLKLLHNVTFAGPVHNSSLPVFYQEAQLVVFPSIIAEDGDREGFGLVLVEALGCECAVIATDLPAMRDIVEDNKTGCIVHQKSSRELALKIHYLLEHPEVCEALGKAGRKYVLARYDWSMIADRYASLLKEMLL